MKIKLSSKITSVEIILIGACWCMKRHDTLIIKRHRLVNVELEFGDFSLAHTCLGNWENMQHSDSVWTLCKVPSCLRITWASYTYSQSFCISPTRKLDTKDCTANCSPNSSCACLRALAVVCFQGCVTFWGFYVWIVRVFMSVFWYTCCVVWLWHNPSRWLRPCEGVSLRLFPCSSLVGGLSQVSARLSFMCLKSSIEDM